MDSKNIDIVNHEGRVTKITDNEIFAEIISGSACASCHAKSICLPSEQKIISIKAAKPSDGTQYSIGEKVNVCINGKTAKKSVFLSYIMPLILIFAVMGTLKYVGVNENISGLAALSSVAIYYFILYAVRKKIEQSFKFTIKKV